jgi:lipoate-protein ligase B
MGGARPTVPAPRRLYPDCGGLVPAAAKLRIVHHVPPEATMQTKPTTKLEVKTQIKAGGFYVNHNETVVATGLPVRTQIKSGGMPVNHNETVARSHC